MSYPDYVSSLSFRWLQPAGYTPVRFYSVSRLLARRLNWHFEIANTRLPADEADTRKRLRGLCLIPKMSTFTIGALINRAVSEMPAGQSFVNVGVWNGFTFLAGLSGNPRQKCAGVDNFSGFDGPREAFSARFERYRSPAHHFHALDYEVYFKTVHAGPIGVYIYDGNHGYEHQLQGLRLAEPFFAPGCIILIDDTNWPHVRRATLEFAAQRPGRYQVLLDRHTHHNYHETLWNGLMVLQHTAG